MPFYTGHIAAASNRADFQFRVELVDPVTNDFVDFTGATIVIGLNYVTGGTSSSPILTGTNHDGHVTVVGPGTCDVHFTRAEMTQFPPGDMKIGITVQLADGITRQIFSGLLPVVDGVVAA